MSGSRWSLRPCRSPAVLLAGLVTAWSCTDAVGPGRPGTPPTITVTVTPSQGDVPLGYVATVRVAGDSLTRAVRLRAGGRQVSIPISGPGTYAHADTLRTPTTDTLRFLVESENGRRDSTTAIVSGTNTPPSITGRSAVSDSVAVGDSLRVWFVVSDTRAGFTTQLRYGAAIVRRVATSPVDTALLWAKPTDPGLRYVVVSVTDGCGATARDSVPVRAFVRPGALAITAAGIRDWIARLSDDSLRGRASPGPDIETAALAIAARFRQLGLNGPFNGAFIQHFPCCSPASSATAPNVGATLLGADSLLKAEFVVIIAHVDALGDAGSGGGCSPLGSDFICNGANDNASGTAAVLELAAAFAWRPERPARSVLFLAVSGEEEGLWGSTYIASHPPVPLANVVAVLNVDMIGRNAPDAIYVAGLGASTLGDRAGALAAAHAELGLRLTPLSASANSDHWPFYSRGIPALMFYNGSNAEYHRPTDTVDLIDADLAMRVARLVYFTALDVLDAPARPLWHVSP